MNGEWPVSEGAYHQAVAVPQGRTPGCGFLGRAVNLFFPSWFRLLVYPKHGLISFPFGLVILHPGLPMYSD